MDNSYTVYGRYTVIDLVKKDGSKYQTLIDTEDLPLILKSVKKVYANTADRYTNYACQKPLDGTGTKALHRLIMNTPQDLVVDHINGNGLDNRKSNLRNCDISSNQQNFKKVHSNSKTGVRGIRKTDRGWQVLQFKNHERHYLGTHQDFEEAKEVLTEWQRVHKPYLTKV